MELPESASESSVETLDLEWKDLNHVLQSPPREDVRSPCSEASSKSSVFDMELRDKEEAIEEMSLPSSPGLGSFDEAASLTGSSSSGMDLGDSECESHSDKNALGSSIAWHPGEDCGKYVRGNEAPPQIQAQVLITNVYLNLRRLPTSVAKAVWSGLAPQGPSIVRNFADRLCSKFMGISHSMARTIHDRLQRNGWIPVEAADVSMAGLSNQPAPVDRSLRALSALQVRVREAMTVVHWGEPDMAYKRAMARLQQHGLPLGTKYLGPSFVEPVEFLTAAAARARTAELLWRKLASLGIPSDLALIFDGLSIGSSQFSRHESLHLLGLTSMCLPPQAALARHSLGNRLSLHAHLIGAPSAGQMHSGREQVALMSETLCEHPGRFTKKVLRARLALASSDGAGAKGGENAEHRSTGTAELFWKNLHPNEDHEDFMPTDWDLFHRICLAIEKAIEDSPCATEIFDVGKVLGSLFGVGDGRVIYRAAADAIGARRFRVPDQGGSRKVVALASTVEHLLKTQKNFHTAMHARIAQSEGAKSRGGQTKGQLINVGRRISALNFIVFMITTGDMLQNRIVPLAMQSQQVDVGPWAMNKQCHDVLADLRSDKNRLHQIRQWCFLTCVLQAYLTTTELRTFWWVLIVSPLGRAFPRLTGNMYNLLLTQTLGGVQLTVAPGVSAGAPLEAAGQRSNANWHTLAPRCQCPSMRLRPRPESKQAYLRGVRGQRGRVSEVSVFCCTKGQPQRVTPKVVSVPEWVAHSAYQKNQLLAPQVFPVPRFVRVPRETAPPLRLQGVSRYSTVGAHRCVVPGMLMFSSKEVLEAIYEAECFLDRVAYYYEGYVVGSIGVNKPMRDLSDNMKTCWDFKHLVWKVPTEQHYHAFFAVYDKLRPTLGYTMWPEGPEFQLCREICLRSADPTASSCNTRNSCDVSDAQ